MERMGGWGPLETAQMQRRDGLVAAEARALRNNFSERICKGFSGRGALGEAACRGYCRTAAGGRGGDDSGPPPVEREEKGSLVPVSVPVSVATGRPRWREGRVPGG